MTVGLIRGGKDASASAMMVTGTIRSWSKPDRCVDAAQMVNAIESSRLRNVPQRSNHTLCRETAAIDDHIRVPAGFPNVATEALEVLNREYGPDWTLKQTSTTELLPVSWTPR